ncbi:MAG: ankyrin repeat domain-containing protein [Desulfarculus sp.]|nr:ankyrin repeat domain-containing protein [Pseudomonadota bacterium]MBU4597457.1 ankyrin repeat domain-containing protein [Pseudomonadota bacterium]MBV1718119.1 ankyrin repeat domain-containing protein [Desulfarculus sp.]MBV1740539.1 ankyrin repeat domain-containing protein [Desulfarculus sp.]
MTEMIFPMDTSATYETAYQAITKGDDQRIEELAAAAPFLITNEELREDGPEPLLNQAILDGVRGPIGLRVVATILDLGADVNYCPPWGCTALHDAAMSLDVAMIKLVLKRGANPNVLDFPLETDDRETVLDMVDWEILIQETRIPGEPDRDPGDVLPMIRDLLVQAGAKGYYEMHPEELN